MVEKIILASSGSIALSNYLKVLLLFIVQDFFELGTRNQKGPVIENSKRSYKIISAMLPDDTGITFSTIRLFYCSM